MIYFTAHTFKCVCHCRRALFRVLGMYNFGFFSKKVEIVMQICSKNGLLKIFGTILRFYYIKCPRNS